MMKRSREICNAFDRQACTYEKAAVAQAEIGDRLFERLDYLTLQPQRILDLGCGTGLLSKKLQTKYPKALVVGLDLSLSMLSQSKQKQTWRQRWPLLNACMEQLPFADGSFDLIFANQVIHWAQFMPDLLSELQRIMAKDACLMFSTLGPDSFQELQTAFATVDNFTHINDFKDMHHLGDALLQAKFTDPVVDMEYLTLHYSDPTKLLLSLKKQGVRNMHASRNPGLMGKGRLQGFKQAYAAFMTEDSKYPLTYEVIYGHAWKGAKKRSGEKQETWISVSDIRRKEKVSL